MTIKLMFILKAKERYCLNINYDHLHSIAQSSIYTTERWLIKHAMIR